MSKEISSHEFQSEVLDSSGLVLVDFSAVWCGPCKMLAPIVEELSKELEGKAKVFKVDVDKSGDIAQRYNITGVPTVMIFKNGKEMDKMVGFQPKVTLKNKLKKYLV